MIVVKDIDMVNCVGVSPLFELRITDKSLGTSDRRFVDLARFIRVPRDGFRAMHSDGILVSETTELSNVMTYRFAIPCEFVHLNGDAKRK